jgi:hypothetical protein
MRFSLDSVKLGALRVLPVVVALAAAGTGCFFFEGSGSDGSNNTAPPPDNTVPDQPAQISIDADATLAAPPGDGVGVFVQYATGGHWTITTSCDVNTDTNPDHVPCEFDVFATLLSPGTAISNWQGQALQGKDALEIQSDGTVHLITETGAGLDGMKFDTDPGAQIELDVWLDGQEAPRFIYWISDGVLHTGAPTDPVDIQAPADK